jgi:pimeloyl-ACP methyl ester carboxylesterase
VPRALDARLGTRDLGLIETNGVRLRVRAAGPEDGPLVLLLHGFPETWYGWRQQIGALAAAGYRVWIPDQRGYGESDKPRGLERYSVDVLVGDVLGLVDAAGVERVRLVGHDWGAAVAWLFAARCDARLERLAILNVPHPLVLDRQLRRNPRQLARSWYMLWFQIPGSGEAMLARDGGAWFYDRISRSGRRGAFLESDRPEYLAAWSDPDARRAMIDWYRAAFQHRPPLPPSVRVAAPTVIIWGERDPVLGAELVEPSLAYCDDAHVVRVPSAGHFVQHDAPEVVNPALLAHLGPPRG